MRRPILADCLRLQEHWFQPNAALPEVLELLCGCSAEETRRGQASDEAHTRRAEAISRYFLGDGRFAPLLLIFHLPNAAPS